MRTYSPTKLCDGAQMAIFLHSVFSVSRVQHVSDLHPKFALRPHHVMRTMVDVQYWLSVLVNSSSALTSLSPLIWAMMIVLRIMGKIIRTVLCCVVYDSCAQWYAHIYEQFLKLTVGLGLGFDFLLIQVSFCVFAILFRYCLLLLC